MSLFKARDWWSTVLGEKEEFDQGCLCVADVDNSCTGEDKIIVGSYTGYLRIFSPHPVKVGDGAQAEDLLLEIHLRDPILQVEVGKFVSGTELLHLAVLHSRKLCVYSVSGTLGNVEHGNQYQVKLMYEHNLQRIACNMTYGSFGGVKELLVCVHGLDRTCCTYPVDLPKGNGPGQWGRSVQEDPHRLHCDCVLKCGDQGGDPGTCLGGGAAE